MNTLTSLVRGSRSPFLVTARASCRTRYALPFVDHGGKRTQLRTASSSSNSDNPLSLSALLGLSEAMLLYLVHGTPGKELDTIRTSNVSTGQKLRRTLHVLGTTQIHVLAPLGYAGTPADMFRFSKDSVEMMQKVNRSQEEETLKSIAEAERDLWGVIAKRAFGVPEVKWLDAGLARSLAMGIGANLSNPSTIAKAEAIGKDSSKSPETRLDQIHDEVIVQAYKSAMTSTGMETSDANFGTVYASIQTMLGDELIGPAIISSTRTLQMRVPLLRGELK